MSRLSSSTVAAQRRAMFPCRRRLTPRHRSPRPREAALDDVRAGEQLPQLRWQTQAVDRRRLLQPFLQALDLAGVGVQPRVDLVRQFL